MLKGSFGSVYAIVCLGFSGRYTFRVVRTVMRYISKLQSASISTFQTFLM